MKKIIKISLLTLLLASSVSVYGATESYTESCKNSPDFISSDSTRHSDISEDYPHIKKLSEEEKSLNMNLYKLLFDMDCTSKDILTTNFLNTETKQRYVMYTSNEESCDGGNTYGFILNLENYENDGKNILIGVVTDGDLSCPTLKSVKEVDKLLKKESLY